jgi:hypothetical protein
MNGPFRRRRGNSEKYLARTTDIAAENIGPGDRMLQRGWGYRKLHCFLHSLICRTHRCTHTVDSGPIRGHSCRHV